MHVRMMGECRASRVQHGRDTDPRAEALGISATKPSDSQIPRLALVCLVAVLIAL
jgi:hypothetical protein